MKVLVLGAGVIGVTSAWYLAKSGHEVTVIDRHDQAGEETSLANGGQISVSHAQPWANPHAPGKILRWLGREDAPLLFRLRADLEQWRWGLAFLRECTAKRYEHNTRQLVALGLYSRANLQALRAETGIQYDQATRGILHFYTNEHEFDAAAHAATVMRERGCDVEMVDARRCVELEPSLREVPLAGGSYSATDESGDAHKFTRALAALAASRGVQFRTGRIVALQTQGARIGGVRLQAANELLRADAYLVCLGSYSPLYLRPLGVRLAIYPLKGYSVTLPVADASRAYTLSLTDDEHKLVFSRLGERLRIAGTAELNGYNTQLNDVRCRAILRRTLELFPGAGDPERVQYWAGLRPATPSNVPYIGATRYPNLYLNTGHGTLGWTHACGSGRAIADVVSGRRPEIEFAFTEPSAIRPIATQAGSATPARVRAR
ncbi:MAG TPA: D-amino acid dehydrogenase [Burkholderiales bacterium]|nr:D-amino acid dehydrogenase [Burkholderiales bacterium]